MRTGLRRQAPIGRDEFFDEVEASQPGGGTQVARVHAALGQDLADLAMAPEEGDDQRRAPVAARGDVDRHALVEQHPRQQREVGVGRLVQRGPAVGVAAGGVRARVEQDADEALVARRARHPEQVVAVGADRRGQVGEGLELGAQAVEVMRLDRAIGAGERLARFTQVRDVAAQRRPAREAVAARDHGTRARLADRRVPACEGRDGALGSVPGGRVQAVGAALVVVEVLVIGVLEVRAVGGEALDVDLQARPAREAVLARDDVLGARELQRLAGLVRGDARDGLRVPGAVGAQQVLGLLAQLLQAGSGRQG